MGDDCAVLAVPPGEQLAVSTDMLVEGRHFLPTVSPQRLGHKALAVNLSDLAACGATPMAFTLALALPQVDEVFLQGFSQGLLALSRAGALTIAQDEASCTIFGMPRVAIALGAARVVASLDTIASHALA